MALCACVNIVSNVSIQIWGYNNTLIYTKHCIELYILFFFPSAHSHNSHGSRVCCEINPYSVTTLMRNRILYIFPESNIKGTPIEKMSYTLLISPTEFNRYIIIQLNTFWTKADAVYFAPATPTSLLVCWLSLCAVPLSKNSLLLHFTSEKKSWN